MTYLAHMAVLFFLYISLVAALDILVGNLGLILLCQSAFFALGAYACAILALQVGLPYWMAAGSAVLITCLISLLVALSIRRLDKDSVVLASFAMLLLLLDLLKNWREITGGLVGLSGIPYVRLFGVTLNSQGHYVVASALLAAFALLLVNRLRKSQLGRAAHALRDDIFAAVGLGVRPLRVYAICFVLNAMIASLAGMIYASYASYINPSVFDSQLSILLLAMVFLGGAATRFGSVVGVGILLFIPELVRAFGGSTLIVGAVNYALFGSVLVLFAVYKPRGVLGGYTFR